MDFINDKYEMATSLVKDWFAELGKRDEDSTVSERYDKVIFNGYDTDIEFDKKNCGLGVGINFNPMARHKYDVELFFDDIKLLIGDLEDLRLKEEPTYLVPAGKVNYFGIDKNGYLTLVDRESATRFTKSELDSYGLSDYKLEKVG